MSESATQERANDVTIEDAGPSRKKLTIEIPAESVDEKLAESIDTLSAEAQMPGFRKGKAPRPLLERKFGDVVRREVKEQLVAESFSKAVEDHKLRVVGDPVAEGLKDVEVRPGQALRFEVEVEVVPEFEPPALDGIEVLRPGFEITDEMVASELQKLCINEGSLEERESPEPGDYLTGHGVMKGADGSVHYDIEGAVVQAPPAEREGKGMILGVLVEDFAAQMGAPKSGETFTIRVKGPENHEVQAIRGDDLTVTFRVDRIDRIIPAKAEDLVRAYGMESEGDLREAIRARLNQRLLIDQQMAMREQIARHLLDSTTLSLPERLSEQQAARTLESRRLDLMYRGVPETDIERHMAELRAASAEAAMRELKLFFILHRVADDLSIGVTEAEINGRIAQLAMEQGVRPEKLRQQLHQRNQIASIARQIREHKAMDAILARASVSDVTAEEFRQRMSAKGK